MNFTHFPPLQKTIISLLSEEPYSLADLKTTTQMSLPTIRQAVQELTEAGWVCAVGRSSSTGGRPATLFGLNGETHLIIGVHLEIPAVNMVLAGLDGRILEQTHEADQETLPPEEALQRIFTFVRQVQARYPQRRLLGLGLAMPGFIDPLTGQILYSIRAPEWQQFPLKLRLEQELGLPVSVENDVDCMTIAELARAQLPDATDMVYLGFSEGVKLSMLLGGQLIKGPFGNAGMLARTSGAENEVREIASVSGVCYEFAKRYAETAVPSPTLQAIHANPDRSAKFKAILDAAETEPLCAEIMTRVIDTLAEEVSRMIFILQPALFIVGGTLSHLPSGLRAQMEEGIRGRLPLLINNHLVIRYAQTVGARVAAVGAVHRFRQLYSTLAPAPMVKSF